MKLAHSLARLIGLFVLTIQIAYAVFTSRAAEAPFDYFQNSWNVIGLKDYSDGTRVTPENELLLADKVRLRFSCGTRLTPLSRRQTKTLLDGWLPVVLMAMEEDGVRYEFTFWATPLPTVKNWRAAYDWPTEGENFLNWIRVKATDLGSEGERASVRLDFLGTNAPPLKEWSVSLAPGKSAETFFRIPFKSGGNSAAFGDADGRVWFERTVSYWRKLMAKAACIEVPCTKATQALRAAHVCQMLVSDHGVLHGGEGFYDEFYIRDGAYQVLELEEAGLFDAARKTMAAYLRAQRPDGRFETQQNQFDANGQAVWALWQFYKITGDRAWLKQAYPQIRRAVEWTMQARRQAPADSPFASVLPNAVADGEYPGTANTTLSVTISGICAGCCAPPMPRASWARRAMRGLLNGRQRSIAKRLRPPGERQAWLGFRQAGKRRERTGETPKCFGRLSYSRRTIHV